MYTMAATPSKLISRPCSGKNSKIPPAPKRLSKLSSTAVPQLAQPIPKSAAATPPAEYTEIFWWEPVFLCRIYSAIKSSCRLNKTTNKRIRLVPSGEKSVKRPSSNNGICCNTIASESAVARMSVKVAKLRQRMIPSTSKILRKSHARYCRHDQVVK